MIYCSQAIICLGLAKTSQRKGAGFYSNPINYCTYIVHAVESNLHSQRVSAVLFWIVINKLLSMLILYPKPNVKHGIIQAVSIPHGNKNLPQIRRANCTSLFLQNLRKPAGRGDWHTRAAALEEGLEALSILLDYTGAKPSGTFSCWRNARAN